MPLFGGKKSRGGFEGEDKAYGDSTRAEALSEEKRAENIARQLSFNSQLAHGSHTVKIADFTNVKELYQRIADGFGLPTKEASNYGSHFYFTFNFQNFL